MTTQTPVKTVQDDGTLDHTFAADAVAGDVVVVGTVPMVAIRDVDYSVNPVGAVSYEGIYDVPKVTGTFTAGDAVYWDTDGTPVTGDALSGAATGTASAGNLMGFATADAASDDSYVRVALTAAKRTATIAGSVTADDITGSDSSLGIAGQSAAQGGAIAIAGGTSSTSGNAGGAVSLVGGTPGATGVGGAATVAGGVGGTTSGAGGATVVRGGAGSNNANGGDLTLRGGAKHGTGTDGAIVIGDSNTASVTFGVNPRIPVSTVAAGGTAIGNANALVEGYNRVTAADDTAAVILPASVAGKVVHVKNTVSNKVLIVFPPASSQVNAKGVNNAYNMAAGTRRTFTCYNSTLWETDLETIG